MDLLQDPRYRDTPVYLFFEKYIMDIIGELPEDKDEVLESIDLQHVFGTKASTWREVVTEALQLSSTINITILHQWYIYKEKSSQKNDEIDSNFFCRSFVDQYFDERSNLDKWTQETLQNAKQYIFESQHLENA